MEGAVLMSGSIHGMLDHVTGGVDASFVQLGKVGQVVRHLAADDEHVVDMWHFNSERHAWQQRTATTIHPQGAGDCVTIND